MHGLSLRIYGRSLGLRRNQRADRRSLYPFVGVDGEGGDIDGEHVYLLLRAGERLLETGSPLTPYQCFAFLADLPKDRYYVAFAFNYDVSMMIRHLPPTKVGLLFNRKAREIVLNGKPTGRYYPVDVGRQEFQIDYLPGKEFRVRRGQSGKFTYISDVFSYFQASFVSTLRKWFDDTPSLSSAIDRIAEGKALRNEFGAVTQYEREYNKLECDLLEILLEKFRAMCTELNIHPKKWQGPGGLVDAVFHREGMPRNAELAVSEVVKYWANHAYYGGRFEVSTYGEIRQKVWQYDINSAYASYYRQLPCLRHGRWENMAELPPDNTTEIFFAECSFTHPNGLLWNTLPVRSGQGTLLFPQSGRGWYWCHEINVARRHGVSLSFYRGYRYVKQCECQDFGWVYDLYDERKAVGKNTGKGKVLKIVLATIYGKLAQSKGHPVWSNPIWSGLVVSYCRATLIAAALQVDRARDVLMLATDGMFCTSPRNLDIGPDLGQWEETIHDDMFIVMSGVYFLPDTKPKTRGVPQAKVIEYESEFRSTWETYRSKGDPYGDVPEVAIPLRVFIGGCLANARGKPWQCGTWREESKTIGFAWNTKRTSPTFTDSYMVTLPVEGSENLRSKPPNWMIGGPLQNLTYNDLMLDQPDWGDQI